MPYKNRENLLMSRNKLRRGIVEGGQGWVLQGVLPRASFRRAAVSGQKFFTVVAAYQQYLRREKRHRQEIHQTLRAIMISQEVDLVAGDFNGTTWRLRSRDNLSIMDEVFTDCALPTPPGPPPLWGPGSIPNNSLRLLQFSTAKSTGNELPECLFREILKAQVTDHVCPNAGPVAFSPTRKNPQRMIPDQMLIKKSGG